MDGAKRGSKGGSHPGGFFQLFDRNGKSNWKKLFSGRSATVESNQGRLDEEKLQSANDHMMEDEKQSEASFVSSSIDDESTGVKAPSVVARLMGLDFLPNADMMEPKATSFYDSRFTHGPNKSPQFGYECQNFYSGNQSRTRENLPSKTLETHLENLQKMVVHERRPINRFQTETLPTKPIKSYADIQHRLLSPIKSSGFVSAKNASHLMETAVKILEPRLSPATKVRKGFALSSSLKDGNEPDGIASSFRIAKRFEIPKKISEPDAVKILKGQAMNKNWNSPSFQTSSKGRLSKEVCSLADQHTVKTSQKLPFSSIKQEKLVTPHDCPNSADSRPLVTRNQGKSISLALQAKVNVQKRENVSCSTLVSSNTGSTSLIMQDEQDEPTFGRNRKTQLHLQKSKQKHATAATNMLGQSNQKHNRLSSKLAGSNQVARKDVGGDAPSVQKLTNPEGKRDCTASGRNHRSQTRKGTCPVASDSGINRNDIEMRTSSTGNDNFPRKKRLIEGGFHSDKSALSDAVVFNGDKSVGETNLTISGCVGQNQCNKQSTWTVGQAVSSNSMSTDVVSFTFTSPLSQISGSRSSGMPLDRQNTKKGCFMDSYGGKNASTSKSPSKSTSGSMMLEGDMLSALLEKKLRELTSGIQMSNSLRTTNLASENTLSILQDFLATLNSGGSILKEPAAECRSVPQESDLVYGSIPEAGISSSSAKLQVKGRNGEETFESQRGHFLKVDEQEDCDHLSPISILDTAFSNDSLNSLDGSDGGQLDHSCQPSTSISTTAEKELSDSATSAAMTTVETSGLAVAGLRGGHLPSKDQVLEYIRDIIANTRLVFEDIAVGQTSRIVSPVLFNRLESNCTIYSTIDQKQIRYERKLWFDVVSECVDSKFIHYSTGDHRSWGKGIAVIGRDGLAEEIFKDVLQWRSMGELMVDEIVDKDMSTGPGRWMNFEKEEFETGLDIEDKILDSLIEEVVSYIFSGRTDASLSCSV